MKYLLPKQYAVDRRRHYFTAVKALRELDPEGAEAWLKANKMYILSRRDITEACSKINHRLHQLRVLRDADKPKSQVVGSRRVSPVYAGDVDTGLVFD